MSAEVLTRKKKKKKKNPDKIIHPVSTGSRFHTNSFRWFTRVIHRTIKPRPLSPWQYAECSRLLRFFLLKFLLFHHLRQLDRVRTPRLLSQLSWWNCGTCCVGQAIRTTHLRSGRSSAVWSRPCHSAQITRRSWSALKHPTCLVGFKPTTRPPAFRSANHCATGVGAIVLFFWA